MNICTVTLNPSLDYIVFVDGFRLGETNRTAAERLLPGGKGINVSLVLRQLGFASTALGFTAGFTGAEIERLLGEMGLRTDFIRLGEGLSRINVKLRSADGTEINGRGPAVLPEDIRKLMEKLDSLGSGDVLVLSGSVPAGVSKEIYRQIASRLEGRGILLAVDAEGALLMDTLPHGPFLIKPNRQELGALFGRVPASEEEVVFYAGRLREMGAKNVLVSMGSDGAVLVDETGSVRAAPAPAGQLVSSVGAGDSMVAGFLAGWLRSQDYGAAFRLGLAAGSATAFCEGLADAAGIQAVYRQAAVSGGPARAGAGLSDRKAAAPRAGQIQCGFNGEA